MKRPTLSAVLPAKGQASRPEPQPVAPTPAAVPTPTLAPAPAPRGRAARPVRIATTLKIREDIYASLREASFREERDKQDLVDEALERLLREMGYLT